MTVVIGVDGAGRTRRLDEIAAAAATAVVRVGGASEWGDESVARVAAAGPDVGLVLVDDAHRLPAGALDVLAAAARRGVPMVVSRRPTLDRPELVALDEAVAERGVELLGPLDDTALAGLISAGTGEPVPAEAVAALRAASGGVAVVAAAVAGAPDGPPPPALVVRMQQRLAGLEPAWADLARLLALRLDLTDDILATATGLAPAALADAMRSLRDAGMLMPDGEQMIPAVARAVLADLPPAARRRLHDAAARALISTGADPVLAATQLRAAGIRAAGAAEAYRAAADRLRFSDPAAALTWYDDALDAGAEPPALTAGRAETAALLGLAADLDAAAAAPAADAARMALVAGAVAAHQGRAVRAGDTLRAAAAPGPLLAVPALVAVGRLDEARAAASGDGPLSLRRFAEAALAVADPTAALPLLIEAAEAVEQAPPTVVLPDTPHALGALVAVLCGDVATAEHLLDRAVVAGAGGPVAADRHRLLLAWARMRTGRYDTALAELRRLAGVPLPGRERLLLAALSAGIARRGGDIARLRAAWSGAEPVLARRAIDLFQVEALEELLVAAARLRERQHVAPVLDALDAHVGHLGTPVAWTVAVGWLRLHLAVADEDAAAAEAVASQLGAATPGSARQRAQCAAARHWARALAGAVDPDAVVTATDALAAVQLPWEASRLAGHAAIRTDDATAARRLLERARDLARAEAITEGVSAPRGGLSDREIEVATLVLAGRTHREIGAQLYLSPKTVEHHVARIRTKVGATSRAELLAALREVVGEEQVT